jgi:hypothetical protein
MKRATNCRESADIETNYNQAGKNFKAQKSQA